MDLCVQTFDKICRVCLLKRPDMLSIFTKMDDEERSLLQILAFTADINVKLEDNLPKQVCRDCQSVMCKADAFKRRCQESEMILINIIESKGETSNIIKNGSNLHENSDIKLKIRNFDSYNKPTNSNICDSKESFDRKEVLLLETNIQPISDISEVPVISTVPITYEDSVKEEVVSYFDEEIDFSDHYLEAESESMPLELKQESADKNEEEKHLCCCGQSFNSKETYKTHNKQQNCNKKMVEKEKKLLTIKNKIECTNCDRKFNTPHAWKQHQCTHRKNSKHGKTCTCKQCLNTSKSDITSIPNHKKIIDEPKTFQCSLCLRKFKNKTSLQTHIERHKEKDCIKHVCGVCKREFKYKAYLENHILAVHSRKNGISCDICALSFPNEKSLELHKESHKNEKKHQCSVCNKSFLMLCTLKEHMRTHTGEKPFLCSQCGRGFSQKTNLAQHMRRHQGLKPFNCESCEKRFVSKGELDAHNRKHSGAHPFVCDDCGNGFTTSSALVKHRRIHTGEKPYQCDLCPMRFAASGTLKNHRRIHTGERPFQCSYCEKAFVQRNDLISHIRCHTGEKPYICTQCGQSFRKAAGLKTHVKMHIKEPVHMLPGVTAMLNGMQCTEQ